ncbi:hypothetical protein GXW83_27325 [Streptacidiphilus sp. PB12-B1b]|uniref:hypothetical protein n=1 Tax=Streptacidiphilus sp. PB12-B1b TaxID=2705012 RepID=UPI0015FE4887|nr:hypothetical protein [Streptacidiphilus sp. PB12-B1b]QMU78858.1 hypothetical protein GXW83_27325 [Streptacidiphilus sp. PB12-B1b]
MRFFSEQDPGEIVDYDFTTFAVDRPLQEAFARAFDAHVGPAGQVNASNAANNAFRQLRYFVDVLLLEAEPPRTPQDLAPRHLKAFLLSRGEAPSAGMAVGLLRSLLANVKGLTPQFAAQCAQWVPARRDKIVSRGSYSPTEEKAILDAARKVVRAAVKRIRESREVLERWREGGVSREDEPVLYEYGSILDMVETTGEMPRNKWGNGLASWIVPHGTVTDLTTRLHLSLAEACALVILLVRLTGENGSTIIKAPAAFHRPDGGAGPLASVQLDLSKPRRGPRRYMTVTLSELPSWASAPAEEGELSSRDELHTPFGLYMVAMELAASSRRIKGSDRLLVYWVPKAGKGSRAQGSVAVTRRNVSGRGFRDQLTNSSIGSWGAGLNLVADEPDEDGALQRLIVGAGRMRVTHGVREQKPVAQTRETLANIYLRRDKSSLREYQKVVADVLEKEVVKARTAGRITRLSTADVAEALRDPETVAKRLGVTAEMMRLLVARDADTVLAACTDNENGPHSPPGEPCRASFLKCLECPCARAMPHHLAVQVVARDMINERRTHMTALRWAEQFALPFAELEDLIRLAGKRAEDRARARAGEEERELVRRLLDGELDER